MDREFLADLFARFGPVTIRRMFSGFGISADGINFALALRSGLYLRADEASFGKFEAAGSQPFSYETRARKMTVRSYWQVPAHLFDDTDEFAVWAREAFAAAQRAALSKRAKKRVKARAFGRSDNEGPPTAAVATVKRRKRATATKTAAKPAKRKTRTGAGKAPAAARTKRSTKATSSRQKSRRPSSMTR